MKKTVLVLGNAPAKRFLKFFFVLGSICLFGVTVKSQTLWTAPAGQAWLLNTNWASSTVPSTTEVAQFGADPTSGATGVGINMNGTTNNGTNNQAVGAIEITNARTANLLIGNSSTSTSGTLTLNGATVNTFADVIVRNNSTGTLIFDNTQALGNQTMTMALGDITDNKIYIDNTGDVVINTVVSGIGKQLTLGGAGTGKLRLNAANTYTGVTNVYPGMYLQLNNSTGNTLPASNSIYLQGGSTLRVSSDQTLTNLQLNNATLIIDAGVTLTINGIFYYGGTISGTGIIKYGASSLLTYMPGSPATTTSTEFPASNGPNGVTILTSPFPDVILHAPRTINGNLDIVAGNLIIGNNDFTCTSVTGTFSSTNHVVTNGTGKLILTNIGAAPKSFPIGATATNMTPLTISNGNNSNYGARVELGLASYPIFNPANAVNRTWFVQASSTPGVPVNVNFFYSAGDGGAGFNYTATVDHGVYTSAWNLNQTGITPAGSYQVPTTVTSFLGGVDLPMVLGNSGSILSTPRSVDLTVQKQSSKAILNWTYNNVTGIKEVAVERSINGRSFNKLGTVASLITTYTDDNLLAGTNYYRIKITDINGKITYSAIAAIINATDGFDIIALLPNIVHTDMQVSIAAAQKTKLDMAITDVMGRPVSKLQFTAIAGSNMFDVNVSKLSAGIYYLTAISAEGDVKTLRFVKF